jgi:hypothetical protein
VNLKTLINVLSNSVVLDLGSAPAGLRIVIEPHTGGLYLTNNSGFFYDIEGNGLGNYNVRQVATKFSTTTMAESDVMLVDLAFHGTAPNGETFHFDLRGVASFKSAVNLLGVTTITLSGKQIVGYGEINSSDSGVSSGSFKARGFGTPEWTGPFSVYWWNFL